ncbi:MAG TPA: CocE/NonD family hydrolase [Candidatus Hydrogenedentes bacterium]|nr:CocE/NonD family hydrolase [Candidatus Hydrogenedentota bacterium]
MARVRWQVLLALSGLLFLSPLVAIRPVRAESVMLPMRDGVRLATDYFLPEDAQPPFPAIVTRTYYGRATKYTDAIVQRFAKRGYAYVIQDVRGRGGSEGRDMAFDDDGWGERQDGADTIAWVAQQPWCNGRIGTWGGSALGIVQVFMAPVTDRVAGQAISVACSDFYQQIAYQGGVFRKALCEDWLKMQKSEHVLEVWHAHPTYDAFWERHNVEPVADRVTAPAVHIGGWWDIFCQGTINNFVTRQHNGGPGAKGRQKLIMGAWLHGPKADPGDLVLKPNFGFDVGKYEDRFLDHYVKGEANGIDAEPPVNYYTLGDVIEPNAPGNEWRTAQDWPPFPTVETAYYLHADKSLSTESAAGGESLAFTYDPANPCPTHGGAELTLPPGPYDQRELAARPDVLVFQTAPLDAPIEITGNVKARLYVSTDAPDTDFTAKFIDIYPDGRQILMLDNIRRLKFWNGYAKAEPVAPGTVVPLEIDLWTISLIVNKGHRIGLHVSSSNYRRFEKNPNTGEDFPGAELRIAHNSVHMGKAHPSALLLPIR